MDDLRVSILCLIELAIFEANPIPIFVQPTIHGPQRTKATLGAIGLSL